jgi:inositol oxygenase
MSHEGEIQSKITCEDKGNRQFRNYQKDCKVAESYRINRVNQTYEQVKKTHSEIFPLGRWKMDILEVFNLLDDIVDTSDPDTKRKQLIHAVQTGEACRKFYPENDWFHLLGFIHDLGKILTHSKMHNLPQWNVTGDTFPLGCQFSDKCIYSDFFKENPDSKHEIYSTKFGVYKENIGFENMLFSFGHDEYLYQVLKANGCTLPDEALYVIRFHSFYPWHQEGAYDYLANEKDWRLLPLLKEFQKCDLYSKVDEEIDMATTLPYYQGLIKKYLPNGIISW